MKKFNIFRSVKLKFVLALVVLVLIATQLSSLYLVQKTESYLIENFQNSVKERVDLLSLTVQGEITKTRTEVDETLEGALQNVADDATNEDIPRVVITNENGDVLAASDLSGEDVKVSNSEKKQINTALSSRYIDDEMTEDSETGDRLWTMAQPVFYDGQVIGCIYVESNMETVYDQIDYIDTALKKGTLFALALTIPIGYVIAWMFTRPISEMRDKAITLSNGKLIGKVTIRSKDEMGQLGEAFNDMSTKLQEAIIETESEKRKLVTVLENMSDGVIATDKRGNIILINERALRLLEIDEEEARGEAITKVLEIDDEYDYLTLLQESNAMMLDYSDASRKYYLRARFTIMQQYEGGFINGIIAVLHDVTEQEKIEDDRKEFVANVSHELRTPLTTMRTYLDALADGAIENEHLSNKFLNVARDETERMIRLVTSLLNLSKMENGTEPLNLHWVDFNKYANRIIDRFELQKERNITFEKKISNQAMPVELDPDKITQVLDNIISNALKYSPDGGKIKFKVQLNEEQNQIEVSIRDQGMGMPKGTVDKIFQRFYRVDKARSRKVGGTGLGLAISKEIITAHNGEIFARSIEGVGTTIIFTLPCVGGQEDDWD